MVTVLCKSLWDSRAFYFVVLGHCSCLSDAREFISMSVFQPERRTKRIKKDFSPWRNDLEVTDITSLHTPLSRTQSYGCTRETGKFDVYFEKTYVQLKIMGFITMVKRIMHMGTTGNCCHSPAFVTRASACTHLPNRPNTRGDNATAHCHYWIQLRVQNRWVMHCPLCWV